jgi:hypothetical protein
MKPGRIAAIALTGSLFVSSAPVTARAGTTADPDLAQILEKSAAARGGLEAWRKVRTMVWTGHVERAEASGPKLPFMFEQRRPNLTRFEIALDRETSVRVFDGQQGWKVHPNASGKPELQPYSEAEVRAARDALVIDGPVLDAAVKGIQVTFQGLDEVEGRKTYRLGAKLPSGTTQRVWIDAESFLEVKYDRPARDSAGRPTTVPVYLRNYQTFEGLKIPFTIETGTPGGGAIADRLVIDRIAINPNLPSGMFARPGLRTSRRGITVDTRPQQGAPGAAGAPSR